MNQKISDEFVSIEIEYKAKKEFIEWQRGQIGNNIYIRDPSRIAMLYEIYDDTAKYKDINIQDLIIQKLNNYIEEYKKTKKYPF